MIRAYDDFVKMLLNAGFSMSGGNDEGIYAIIPWGWNDAPPCETPICWHTGDPDTDPWEWRMRVLEEHSDIAYAKLFFKKSGYITKEWYPYFLAARRGGITFDEAYKSGTISHFAKRIYEITASEGALPLHSIKGLANFSKEDKSGFDRALTELQMKMFLTICGRQQKSSHKGENIAWASTVFCTTEVFFGDAVFEEASKITKDKALEKIREQISKLNPAAQEKRIEKFILG